MPMEVRQRLEQFADAAILVASGAVVQFRRIVVSTVGTENGRAVVGAIIFSNLEDSLAPRVATLNDPPDGRVIDAAGALDA
jgi:hypothetical protein